VTAVKFGIWHDFRNPEQWRVPWGQLYSENLDQIALAESLGFESVWLSEHHVTDDGYLPSVFPMMAAIAERTTTIRIGTSVMLAPFQHPLRFAEDVAFVDQLSGGRVEMGLGLGYRDREFEVLGVPRSERGARTVQLIEAARRIWADCEVMPPPYQSPEPPLWFGGATETAARRAARLGCHFMPGGPTVGDDVLALYRSLSDGNVAISAAVYVGERADVADHFLYTTNRYRDWGGQPHVASIDELPSERFIIGDAPHVADVVQQIIDRTRCDRFFFWSRPAGLSIDRANESLGRFARDVIPRLHTGTETS
jgi:alkanesulfonate monooxygenase SsuD/methylene tetrahydromethanopterin reductase-like flavin-dependent oxidoreductase (luciferase family)